tara:strand:- start:71884 stop:72453 length:570 start_codon:yes stop_codon:yes gene_type:complete
MSTVVVLLFSCVTSAAELMAPRCNDGVLHPTAPAETTQFSFLLGDFSVTLHAWQGNGWSPPRPTRARWNGWYGLNGMAIVDEWYDPEPGINPNGGRGINVRMYDPEEAIWKMMWMSTSGKQVADLRAQLVDGVLTMWQIYPLQSTKTKSVFEVIDPNRWARMSYVQDEETEDWLPRFRLVATRIPCGPR